MFKLFLSDFFVLRVHRDLLEGCLEGFRVYGLGVRGL